MKLRLSGTKPLNLNTTQFLRYLRNPKLLIAFLFGSIMIYLIVFIRHRSSGFIDQRNINDLSRPDLIRRQHDSRKSNFVKEISHHFMTEAIDMMACSKQPPNLFNTQSLPITYSEKVIHENDNNGVSYDITVNGHSFAYYQLCFATHPGHQHSFKISLVTARDQKSTGSNLQSDCDMYLSASTFYPSPSSWDWKSDDKGFLDTIILNSYSKEFKLSDLNALFISVTGKNPDTSNHCVLNVQVNEVSTEMLLHKLSTQLRGGQVLLPRDVDRIISVS